MCRGVRHVEMRKKSEHEKCMKREMMDWALGNHWAYLAETV